MTESVLEKDTKGSQFRKSEPGKLYKQEWIYTCEHTHTHIL